MASNDMAAPARKYAGKLKIEGGPVPIKVWQTKEYRNRARRGLGGDLRGERGPGVPGSNPEK